jgi:hypothetical protein
MSNLITLSNADLALGYLVGLGRDMECISRGKQHRSPLTFPLQGISNHIGGVLGEIAAARWAGLPLFFPSIDNFSGGDGDINGFQVRSVPPKLKDGEFRVRSSLMVRMTDDDNDKFILVLADARDFTLRTWHVVGWAFGHEVKEKGTLGRMPPPAKFLSAEEIRPATDDLRKDVFAAVDADKVRSNAKKYLAKLTAINRRLFGTQLKQAKDILGVTENDVKAALTECRDSHRNGASPDDLTWDWTSE